jgi:norsolorinic acid ketoreductase
MHPTQSPVFPYYTFHQTNHVFSHHSPHHWHKPRYVHPLSLLYLFFILTISSGIGKGLVATYLAVPNTTVVATVRDPSHPTAQSLCSLPKASGSSLIVITLDVSSTKSIESGIKSLISAHNIDVLDVVIANAGLAEMSSPLTTSPVSELQKFVDTNAFGQFELFKAVAPLLRASKAESKGKFVLISSAGGSLTTMNVILPLAAYGASKALANFLIKWLALENEDLVIWAQHPGYAYLFSNHILQFLRKNCC